MSYICVSPPSDSDEVVCRFSGSSDRSISDSSWVRLSAQGLERSGWRSRAPIIMACCLILILVVSGCGYSTSVSAASNTSSLVVSPSAVDFGAVPIGQAVSSNVSFANRGAASVDVSQVTVAGQTFFVNNQSNLPATIAPGGTYSLEVGFKPAGDTTYTGQLIAVDSAARQIAQGTLNGSGISDAASTAKLSVSTTSLSFGNVTVGQTSTLPVTLTASGTASVTISSAAISGTGFSVSGATFPLTLSSKQSVTLEVQSAPMTTGAMTGSLTISSNASNAATTVVSLTSTGVAAPSPQLTVSPASLIFGGVGIGVGSTLPLTIKSTGTGPLTINAATVVGTGFTFSGASFPATLNPGQTLTLEVEFAPTVANAATGTLTISSNAARHTTTAVVLSGTGTLTTPQLTVSPTSLSFGDVTDGSNATLGVTLTSSGTAAVTVNSATISGTGFTVSGATFPVTLSPQQTVTLDVEFAPTTASAATGSLTVSSNSSTNPTATVSLSGTGVLHQVALTWDAPTSSPDPVAGYNIYRATGTSSSYTLVNPSIDTLTSYTDTTVIASTAYTYYVESVDASGNQSGPSNSVSVTVP